MKLTNYNEWKKTIVSEINTLKSRGFISFVLSSSISRAISFLSIMFLARILSKSDYGLLSYIDNIRNYVLILNGLGFSNVILRYCAQSENLSKNKGYLHISLVIGTIFDVIIIIGSILFFTYLSFDYPEANQYLLHLALFPLFMYIFESLQMYFRATFKNKLFSLITVVYSVLMISLQITLGYFFDIIGIIYGRYLAVLISLIIASMLYFRKYRTSSITIYPDRKEIKKMILLGLSFLVAGASSTMIVYNETLVVSRFTLDRVILADYKAATLILQISYFFINSIVLFIFPYFVKNRLNILWIKRNFTKLTKYLIIFMLPLHLGLYLFMNFIILIIFGESYLTAVPFARLILVSSLIQTIFRMPLGNVLIAIGKEKANLVINLVSLIIHFALLYYLTTIYSVYGALIATMIVYFLSSIIMFIVLYGYMKESGKNEISTSN